MICFLSLVIQQWAMTWSESWTKNLEIKVTSSWNERNKFNREKKLLFRSRKIPTHSDSWLSINVMRDDFSHGEWNSILHTNILDDTKEKQKKSCYWRCFNRSIHHEFSTSCTYISFTANDSFQLFYYLMSTLLPIKTYHISRSTTNKTFSSLYFFGSK